MFRSFNSIFLTSSYSDCFDIFSLSIDRTLGFAYSKVFIEVFSYSTVFDIFVDSAGSDRRITLSSVDSVLGFA